MNTIQEHLLYCDVIENDGKVSQEPTIFGAALLSLGGLILVFAAGWAIALLR